MPGPFGKQDSSGGESRPVFADLGEQDPGQDWSDARNTGEDAAVRMFGHGHGRGDGTVVFGELGVQQLQQPGE